MKQIWLRNWQRPGIFLKLSQKYISNWRNLPIRVANANGLIQILSVFSCDVCQNTMYTFVLTSAFILNTFLIYLTAILNRKKVVE